MRLLVIEAGHRLTPQLRQAGHEAAPVANVRDALAAARSAPFDVIVLDGSTGVAGALDGCGELSRAGTRVPILVIVARDAADTRVAALDAGAADSLSAPYMLPELLARLRALARRTATSA